MDLTTNQNFLSVDGKTARSSTGEYFSVGEVVAHQDETAGTSVIKQFEPLVERNEVRVHTSRGFAHVDFLVKVK